VSELEALSPAVIAVKALAVVALPLRLPLKVEAVTVAVPVEPPKTKLVGIGLLPVAL
jgi:hypothetical protein